MSFENVTMTDHILNIACGGILQTLWYHFTHFVVVSCCSGVQSVAGPYDKISYADSIRAGFVVCLDPDLTYNDQIHVRLLVLWHV